MVFLGRKVTLQTRPGYGRLIIGRWVHLGDLTRLRAHEGTLRVGDKVVMGSDNTINCYLDVEIGAGALISDWVYVCDFDHVIADLNLPIKDQGIVKTPVRIGPGCWLGVKSSVLRGTLIGADSVLGAHSVARGVYPDHSIVVGVPGRVVADRATRYAAAAAEREALADMARKNANPLS
jgi:acetyltransferase-like isoleucine patch superfamily enzyme